jgi:serine protease
MRRLLVLLLGLSCLSACKDDGGGDPLPPTTGKVQGTLTPFRGQSAAPLTSRPALLQKVGAGRLSSIINEALALGVKGSRLEAGESLPIVWRAGAAVARRAPATPEVIPGELIVRFEEGSVSAMSAVERMAVPGYRVRHKGQASEHLHLLRFEPEGGAVQAMAGNELQRVAEQLRRRPGVRYVEENVRLYPTAVPNDKLYTSQWHYPAMNLPATWDEETGAARTVVVAVVDTGIKPHPDLVDRLLPGADTISDPANAGDGNGVDTNPNDEGKDVPNGESSWHGTHVAGTIAATTNNNNGVAGVNWGAKIVPVRVLGREGGSSFDIAAGIRWAAGASVPGLPNNVNPAKVINMSLGGPGSPNSTFQDAINEAQARGAIVVIAAGNSNEDATNTRPCNQQNVICVGAVGFSGKRASYSNYGAPVDVVAPGGEMREDLNGDKYPDGVLSTAYDQAAVPQPVYSFENGTSMATPHVAGLVSLMVAVNPTLTQQQAETILKATASPAGQCNEGCGAGAVNAQAAVLSARNGGGTPGNPNDPPKLGVASTQMSFFGSGTQQLLVRNLGGGTLQANVSVGGSRPNSVSVSSATVSAPAFGTAQLGVTVNTSGLTAGDYSAQVTLTGANGAGSATVLVKFRAGSTQDKDAIIAFVYEDATGEWQVDEEGIALVNAAQSYRYALDLKPNTYYALATIDEDGDDELFEDGERVGFWRNTDEILPIEVKVGQAVNNISFDLVPFQPVDDTPPLQVGLACTSDAQCPGGFCATGFPGGYCTIDCLSASCPAGSQCYGSSDNTVAYCLATCGSQFDCRTGYVCADDGAGGGACVPP